MPTSTADASLLPTLLGDFLVWLFGSIVGIFFREIRTRGAHKIPLTGPVIFVAAPHANQFLDPVMVMRCVPRRVGFLCAQKTMDRKYVGKMAKGVQAIPVSRAQDMARKGAGHIQLLDRYNQPTHITGIRTRFTSQLQVGWSIALPQNRGVGIVAEIISDTELRVTKEFRDLAALELLTSPNGTVYKVMPYVDQSEVYRMVHERLTDNGCIGIFPEGGSHDRAEMLPLKAGATVMALGAMAAHPGLDVKIVPIGLNYFHPDRFRSRAVVEFGNAITVEPTLVEKFKQGGEYKREACAQLLNSIYIGLKSVTVNCPDYETLMMLQAARRLYQPPVKRRLRDTARVLRLQRRLVEGYLQVKDEPAVIEVRERVMKYNTLLSYYGLRDHQVRNTTLDQTRALQLLIWRLLSLLFMAALVLPGLLINLPWLLVASVISKRKAKEALAASTVKIKGRDVLATWKVLVALLLVPILYLVYATATFFLAIRWQWTWQSTLGAPLLALWCLPTISYMSVLFAERGADIYKSLRPLSLALLPFGREQLRILPMMREELSRDITTLVNELGPRVFPDFDVERAFRSRTPDAYEGEESPTRGYFGRVRRRTRNRSYSRGRFFSSGYSDNEDTGNASSGAVSGATTPGLISLRGWIKSPIELLDSSNFNWGAMDDKEDQDDDVFFHGSRRTSMTATSRASSRSNSMSASSGFLFHHDQAASQRSGDTLLVPGHSPQLNGAARDHEASTDESLYTVAAQMQVHSPVMPAKSPHDSDEASASPPDSESIRSAATSIATATVDE